MTVLSLPLAVAADGGLLAIAADSAAAVEQATALLLDTRPRERRAVPDYGTPDPRGAGLDPGAVLAAVERWEPRAADILTIEVTSSPDGTVEYAVAALHDGQQQTAAAG